MEWMSVKEAVLPGIKKYRFFLLLLLTGLLILQIPNTQTGESTSSSEKNENLRDPQKEMEEVLSLVKGAGKVRVLLTYRKGEETVYQTDEDQSRNDSTSDSTRKTLVVTGENRVQTGLIRQVNPPVLQGALIVCQGGDNPQVKYAVVEAVTRLTGLPSNSICVLKMK